jgi:RHS repeat-associated protein
MASASIGSSALGRVNALWVAESDGTVKITTSTGDLLFEMHDLKDVRAVAVDQRREAVWLYAESTLAGYDFDGNQLLAIAVGPAEPGPAELAMDETSGTAWLAVEKQLWGFFPSGEELASLHLDSPVKALAVDADASTVWIGTPEAILAYFPASADLVQVAAIQGLQDLEAEPTTGGFWVAQQDGLRRYDAGGDLLFAVPMPNLVKIAADGKGGAWAATGKEALRVSSSGEVLFSLEPLSENQGEIVGLASDPADGSGWVAGPNSVIHLSAAGQLRHVLDLEPPVEISDLGLSSDTIPPTLAILAPQNGSSLATATPTLRVGYSDLGAGVDPGTLSFQVNGTALAATCSPAEQGATCAPASALAEGTFSLTATVRDFAGNLSAPARVIFTIGSTGSGLPPDPATVAPVLDPTVAGDLAKGVEFLYTGEHPIQTGVPPGTIDARRVGVLRGQVRSRDGSSLAGVAITIVGHGELGATLSRVDGMFDLAVNGGGPLTLEYRKAGFLPVQRTVEVPWRDYARVEDAVLVPFDPQATVIATGSSSLQVARGGAVSDGDGARQATVLFPPGTQAELVLADGSRQPLATLTARATEYTVGDTGPAAMPAPLPPSSGYTYAVELSADEALAAGALRVDFNQPVVLYVENFLAFPVGGIVPAGSYDRQKAAWLAEKNGRVVKIVSITAGLADLDLNGSGLPADAAALTALGVGEAERRELAALYVPGESLWRVPIPHFTPYDCNWPYGPPKDAEEPPDPDKEEDDEGDEDDPCTQSGSILECENQILGERVPVVGTPFRLHYQSDRVPGRRVSSTLKVPLSQDRIPVSLRRIELAIGVAGRYFSQSFPAAPNLTYTFAWDGKDAYGRSLQGKVPATVAVGYVYGGVYYTPAEFDASFAAFSPDLSISRDQTRREITLWRHHQRTLGIWDARATGLGGWDLDVHHSYDPGGQLLLLGDGTRRKGGDLNRQMEKVPFSFETSRASDIGISADGTAYVIDTRVHQFFDEYWISGRSPNGQLRTFRVSLPDPVVGIGVAPDGNVYFAKCRDFSGAFVPQILRLSPDGNKVLLFQAPQIACPTDVAVERDGSLLIADSRLQRILRVRPDGAFSTVAGSDDPAAGDVGSALRVRLSLSGAQLALGPDGTIYFSEPATSRIRRIGTDGQVVTIAGTGTAGITADGGLAVQARIQTRGLTVAADGSVLFAESDFFKSRVRRITPSGILVTEAGGDSSVASSEGPQPPSASMLFTDGVALRPNGDLLISLADPRARRVSSSSTGFSAQDIVLASADGRSAYVFNREGRHLSTRDALTGATIYRFTYTSTGALATVEDAFGNVTRIDHDAQGRPTAIVAPFAQRTDLAVDANGYLSSIKNPAGETTRFAYTSDGLLTAMTDPRGATAQYTYSGLGRLLTAEDRAHATKQLLRFPGASGYQSAVVSPLGRQTAYQRQDLANRQRVRSTTTPAGLTTTAARAGTGAVSVTEPTGTVTTLIPGADPRFGMQAPLTSSRQVRTPSGLTLSVTSARTATLANSTDPFSLTTLEETVTTNGRTARRVYNASQRKFTFTSAGGRTSSMTLDVFGRPVLFEVAGLAPTSLSYDVHGRVSAITQGSGPELRSASLGYGTDGWLSELLAPLGYHLGFERDGAGRVSRQALPDGREIAFGYDANGNLASLAPPMRPSHGFGFTPIDLLSEYRPPALGTEPGTTTYGYNLDRQLTRIARADGKNVDTSYGSDGRLAALGFTPGQLGFSYEPTTGNLSGVTAPGERLSYTYDGFLLSGTAWSGTVAGSVTFTYDTDFRIASQKVNGANSISFQYDSDSLLTKAGSLTLARSSQNRLLTGTTLGQITTTQTYNLFAELATFTASFQGTPLFSTSYTRDSLGRIAQKVETSGGASDTFNYTYDVSGRLTDVAKNGTSLSHYDYDGNGNRTAYTSPSRTLSATYDAQDRLLVYGDTTYTYSANGELKSKTQNGQIVTYDYDELGNLRKVVLPDGITIEYVIDGQNRRVGKKVNGVLVQGFLYQDQLNPIAELDGAGNVVSRFVYGSRPNTPDYMVRGGVTYRILTDHLGSPRLVVNASTSQVAQRMDFDEFGRVILDTNAGFQPFGFAGGLYDRHTDFVRFGRRDYEVGIGRWVAKDPIGFGGKDTNLYTYSLVDPVNRVDPEGLRCINKSPSWVPVKPEEGDKPIVWLPPGETYNGRIDGVRPPAWNNDWFKVAPFTDVTITPQGDASASGAGAILTYLFWANDPSWWIPSDQQPSSDRFPGRKQPNWPERHHDWIPPAPPSECHCSLYY